MKTLAVVSALALVAIPAFAQEPPPAPPAEPLQRQVEQTQLRLHAAQADHYLAVARSLQQQLSESAAQAAATQRWWDSWWAGMYPAAPAGPPQK